MFPMFPFHFRATSCALPTALATVLVLTGCAATHSNSPMPEPVASLDAVFTVQAEGQRTVVRALTQGATCPGIAWDGQAAVPMAQRVAPATLAARGNGVQKDNKESRFDVLTCEANWPAGVTVGRINGQTVPAPRATVQRIVIIADTGCRLKASENAYQPCNDPQKWPFAQIAQRAAATKPDLVIHIGDIHYRESPCPAGNTGCTNSPWGYGYDAWQADLFKPAKPLLQAAPWLFVRGNHEACARAGQGWFRFLDAQPWRETRSCNDPTQDSEADYSEPFAVPVATDTQLIVFDSAKTSGKPYTAKDAAYGHYAAQMQTVDQLAQQKPHSFFMSHHPLLAFASVREGNSVKPGGNAGLQSVFSASHPERLFPEGINLTLHGHIHVFEAISFKTAHPTSLVMGNAGSANEGGPPESLPAGAEPYPGAVVEDYASRAEFGFATLERSSEGPNSDWLLTEYDVMGKPVIRCDIHQGKSLCKPVRS